MKSAIGIDLGGTNIKGVLLHENGTILQQHYAPTDDAENGQWREHIAEMVYFLKNSYFVICFFLIIGLLLSCILVLIPYFFSGRTLKPVEKVSEYECGFEPFDSAIRQPFTIHFYIVGILFLIFDVEIALLFP